MPTIDDEVQAVEKLRSVQIDQERANDAFGVVLDLLVDYLLKRTFSRHIPAGSFQDKASAIIERAKIIGANWPEHREFMEEVIKFMNEWLPIGIAYAKRRRAEKTEKKLMGKLAQDGLAVT